MDVVDLVVHHAFEHLIEDKDHLRALRLISQKVNSAVCSYIKRLNIKCDQDQQLHALLPLPLLQLYPNLEELKMPFQSAGISTIDLVRFSKLKVLDLTLSTANEVRSLAKVIPQLDKLCICVDAIDASAALGDISLDVPHLELFIYTSLEVLLEHRKYVPRIATPNYEAREVDALDTIFRSTLGRRIEILKIFCHGQEPSQLMSHIAALPSLKSLSLSEISNIDMEKFGTAPWAHHLTELCIDDSNVIQNIRALRNLTDLRALSLTYIGYDFEPDGNGFINDGTFATLFKEATWSHLEDLNFYGSSGVYRCIIPAMLSMSVESRRNIASINIGNIEDIYPEHLDHLAVEWRNNFPNLKKFSISDPRHEEDDDIATLRASMGDVLELVKFGWEDS
jgi:hypothetical protein